MGVENLKNIDIHGMTRERLIEELERYRDTIREVRDARGDDQCHLATRQIFNLLPECMDPMRELPPCDVFLSSCLQFWENKSKHGIGTEDDLHEWSLDDEGGINALFIERFDRLLDELSQEVAYLAHISLAEHKPRFVELVKMSKLLYVFLLNKLEEDDGNTHLCMYFLATISGIIPYRTYDAGNIPRMKEAWLRWGRREGYIN